MNHFFLRMWDVVQRMINNVCLQIHFKGHQWSHETSFNKKSQCKIEETTPRWVTNVASSSVAIPRAVAPPFDLTMHLFGAPCFLELVICGKQTDFHFACLLERIYGDTGFVSIRRYNCHSLKKSHYVKISQLTPFCYIIEAVLVAAARYRHYNTCTCSYICCHLLYMKAVIRDANLITPGICPIKMCVGACGRAVLKFPLLMLDSTMLA